MREFLILLAATGLALFSFTSAAETTVQPLRNIDTLQTSGYSMLVRKGDSLLTRLETSQPAADREVWWLVFNNPTACETRPCTFADIYRRETRADLIRADEELARLGSVSDICLPAGEEGRSLMPELGLMAAGLEEVETAEIHVVVAGSAPGLKAMLARARSDFSNNCGGSQCSQLMVAVHAPKPPLMVAANLDR